MIALETASELHTILSINDVTIIGVLLAVIIALGYTIRHLYHKTQEQHKEYIDELRANNKTFIEITEKYTQATNNSTEAYKNLSEILRNKN